MAPLGKPVRKTTEAPPLRMPKEVPVKTPQPQKVPVHT